MIAKAASLAYTNKMIEPWQIAAAREAAKWTQKQLALAANVSEATIKNIERGVGNPRLSTLKDIKAALESAGVEFISDRQNSPDGGPGIRLRK